MINIILYPEENINTTHTYFDIMSCSNDHHNICDNCSDEDGRVYIHTMCQECKDKNDVDLFQQTPPGEDCPICFLTLPSLMTRSKNISHVVEKLYVVDAYTQLG